MMSNDEEIETVKAVLAARLAEIDDLNCASAESRKPVALDQQSVGRLSRMDAMQVQAMALAAERRRAGERQRILAAMERIEKGDHGYCVRCGEAIGEARLRLDPTVPLCLPCARGARPDRTSPIAPPRRQAQSGRFRYQTCQTMPTRTLCESRSLFMAVPPRR